MSAATLEHSLQQLREASVRYDREALSALLRVAVPEFQPIGEHPDYKESATVVAFPARNARKI
ncbi:hypothetical protein D3C71_2215920 [compost metagenome]